MGKVEFEIGYLSNILYLIFSIFAKLCRKTIKISLGMINANLFILIILIRFILMR
jgi:hypothetical protein